VGYKGTFEHRMKGAIDGGRGWKNWTHFSLICLILLLWKSCYTSYLDSITTNRITGRVNKNLKSVKVNQPVTGTEIVLDISYYVVWQLCWSLVSAFPCTFVSMSGKVSRQNAEMCTWVCCVLHLIRFNAVFILTSLQ